MSGVFGRVVGKLLVSGGAAAGRAFAAAFKQAVANAKQGRAAGQSAASAAASAFSKGHLSVDEARAILNVKEDATPEQVEERFEKIFTNNDAEKGGSFYLQSKAFRARETLLAKLVRDEAVASAKADAAAGQPGPEEDEPKDARK